MSVKLAVAAVAGQTAAGKQVSNGPTNPNGVPTGLVGRVNEAQLKVGGVDCIGLVDTGSQVSTVTETFFRERLKNIPLHPLEDVLKVECAAGQHIPYAGYIEAEMEIPGKDVLQMCLFLVVPETEYSSSVPVLVGTNVLEPLQQKCRDKYGPRYLQKTVLANAWILAFKLLRVHGRQQKRAYGQVSVLKCAARATIRVPPGGRVVVPATTRTGSLPVNCQVMVETTQRSMLPAGVEVTPTALRCSKGIDLIKVEVTNMLETPIVIQPSAVIAELQKVSTVPEPRDKDRDKGSGTEQGFLDTFDLKGTGLSRRQVQEAHKLLLQYRDVFSEGEFDIGCTTTVKHRIDLTDTTPFKQRHRRIPPNMYEEVREHLRQLQEAGIIRKSNSPFASPVVLVRKKNGALRFCVDYRVLNNRTIKDSYALPRIEELMDHFTGSEFFSSLDMRSGFYQVEVEESHKVRTAFTVGPLGFYEFNRMSMGLSNSPASYQRLMEFVLGDLHMKECYTFIDDCIVPGKNFDEGMERLERVFQRLRQHKLKLNAAKCQLFKTRVKYCGHIISKEGIEADPGKIERITDWPIPQNVTQVREFLGFAGYYRRFVHRFSHMAKPLNELLGGSPKAKKGKKKQRGREDKQKPPEWKWEEAQQAAFDSLKNSLSTPPILAYAQYDLPFVLYTDASGKGLGAVLSQNQDGQERVIACASRGLSSSERNYPVHKLEFLALKWAVTDKFSDYLYGAKHQFTVYTDNNPLTYVQTTAKLDATGHRWLAELAAFKFNVVYRPGKSNANADILSRLPKETDNREEYVIDNEAIQAIGQACSVSIPLAETLCMSTKVLDADDLKAETTIGLKEIRKQQREDPDIGQIYNQVCQGRRPNMKQLSPRTRRYKLAKEFDRLKVRRGLLYRVTKIDEQERMQVVMPKGLHELVLTSLHGEAGHQGRDKTLSLVQDRFYWPGMAADIEAKVRTIKAAFRCCHLWLGGGTFKRKGTAPS